MIHKKMHDGFAFAVEKYLTYRVVHPDGHESLKQFQFAGPPKMFLNQTNLPTEAKKKLLEKGQVQMKVRNAWHILTFEVEKREENWGKHGSSSNAASGG